MCFTTGASIISYTLLSYHLKVPTSYHLGDTELATTTHKDLGIMVMSTLSWSA